MRKQIVVIMDGKYFAIDGNVVASGNASEIKKELEDMSLIPLTILPHEEISCAAFARVDERRFFLMYAPSKRRLIKWKNKSTGERKEFMVWFPHLYIGLFFRNGAIEHGHAMVTSKKIKTAKDLLNRLPLPNTSGVYGHICEGAKGAWDVTADTGDTAFSYIKYFLESEYISDINDHFQYVPKLFWPANWDLGKKIYEDYVEQVNQEIFAAWQHTSETDIERVKTLDWGARFTIPDLIRAVWENSPDGLGPAAGQIVNNILGQVQVVGDEE
jgi:hypothetical protein